MELTVKTPKGVWELECPLIGEHNVSNLLVAMGMALAMGFSRARIERGLKKLTCIPGRLERVPSEDGVHIFVDYAHTPDALTQVLRSLRNLVQGKIIVVFGCGGDRDQEKRSVMGEAVAKAADRAIVTNDNPRSEDPAKIAEAIEAGMTANGWSVTSADEGKDQAFSRQLDRREAIRTALAWAQEGDIVLLAGKGHETNQLIGSETHYFNDAEEARCLVGGAPPPAPPVDVVDSPSVNMSTVEVAIDDIEEVNEAEIAEDVAANKLITSEVDFESIESSVEIEEVIVEDEGPPEESEP
jgi:UDP-N-acetylmuramyl-tripeptide synthetase